MDFDVIVIGAGAAGCIAAITAAERGRNVAVIEKNGKVGKKIRITGKGRCNVTNNCDADEFMKNIPVNSRFLFSSYSAFSSYDVINFFERAGVPLKTERGNRVFPVSDNANDIAAALEKLMKKRGVKFIKERVVSLIIKDGVCSGVKTENSEYSAENVLVATGGASYPLTGSTGDGYNFAKAVGHSVTDIVPSLVPLEISEKFCGELSGLNLKNVSLSLYDGNKKVFSELGEMSFTYFGVSGPLVLTASSRIRKMEKDRYRLVLDLKPGLDEKKLDARLLRDYEEFSKLTFSETLRKLLPAALVPVVVRLSGIPGELKAGSISKKQRQDLIRVLKGMKMTITGFRPVEEAIVTSGGVSVKEIDPKTMKSKICDGLYFAGEIIDVDGYTGGFNLQIAFSTGHAAGENI